MELISQQLLIENGFVKGIIYPEVFTLKNDSAFDFNWDEEDGFTLSDMSDEGCVFYKTSIIYMDEIKQLLKLLTING